MARMNRSVIALLCLLALGFPSSAQSDAPVLRVGVSVDPPSLNPMQSALAQSASVFALITEKLFFLDPEDPQELIPWLVEDWSWVDDTTLELSLREGVSFTNGEPWDAEALKFSLEEFIRSDTWSTLTRDWADSEIEIADDHTVHIRLQRPLPHLVGTLARFSGLMAVPPVYYQQVGADGFANHPVGTGPFVLAERRPGDRIVLDRNEGWWRGSHAVDQVVFRVIPDDAARIAALEAGEIDIAVNVPVSAIDRLESRPDIDVHAVPGERKFVVTFNVETPDWGDDNPLRDPRVRQAMNHAVDLDAIVEHIFGGQAIKLEGQYQIPGVEEGYSPEVHDYGYDPELARSLLAEAGYPDGFRVTFLYPVGRYAMGTELAEIVAAYLRDIGVDVAEQPVEYGELVRLREPAAGGNSEWPGGHLVLYGLGHGPAAWSSYTFLRDSWDARGIYMIEYSPEFVNLVEELGVTIDAGRRQEILHRLAELVHEEPPAIFLIAPTIAYATSDRVQGFVPRPDEHLWIFDVSLAD